MNGRSAKGLQTMEKPTFLSFVKSVLCLSVFLPFHFRFEFIDKYETTVMGPPKVEDRMFEYRSFFPNREVPQRHRHSTIHSLFPTSLASS